MLQTEDHPIKTIMDLSCLLRRAMEQEDPKLDSRAYHKMIDKFENIGVNPVPLPAKKDICDLPSLFEWL